MNKVMKSVNPKDSELIASGKKTVIISKTKPKINIPFKCYLYTTKETKGTDILWILNQKERRFCGSKIASLINAKSVGGATKANGKVIGEFICNKAEKIVADGTCHPLYGYGGTRYNFGHLEDAQLNEQELYDYLGEPVILTDDPCYKKMEFNGYAWYISNLTIYDKPRELSEFWGADKCPYASKNGCTHKYHCFRAGETKRCGDTLSNPPRNWCYIKDE